MNQRTTFFMLVTIPIGYRYIENVLNLIHFYSFEIKYIKTTGNSCRGYVHTKLFP